jgi:hypothetical protein
MFFIISHIYREDNKCVDGIATPGLQVQEFQLWDTIHNNTSHALTRNRFGLPEYRLY